MLPIASPAPHGGTLINAYLSGEALRHAIDASANALDWDLTERQLFDLELLLNGAFSPLTGFLNRQDHDHVVASMRLSDGTLWPMPINLDVTEAFAASCALGQVINLRDPEGVLIAQLEISDMWHPDRLHDAEQLFTTVDKSHPGVADLLDNTHPVYLGGRVVGINPPTHYDFKHYRHSPAQLREQLSQRTRPIIAFQTRNPIHKAHVIMLKRLMAKEQSDLLIHTAVGRTKPGDIDHFCRVRCYEKILNRFPTDSALISLLPLAMRMGGPREALWQAIIRQNYGIHAFVVGRDHAGPGRNNLGGSFYNPLAAQELVQAHQQELKITILKAPFLRYVPERGEFCEEHELLSGEAGLYISGSDLKRKLLHGDPIPEWFAYEDIIEELNQTLPARSKQGITLFFTGLSGSGKSTVANGVMVKLRELGGRNVTLLDGDVVRKHLSSELTFSKEHRDLNIARIGFVASEISKNGGVAICAPIAPYTATRRKVRSMLEGKGAFIEIHISTPIEVCEQRDRKGLYAQARAGKIKGFTGIDDPYEIPAHPELAIDTSQVGVEGAIETVMQYLENEGLINRTHQ